MTRFGHKLNYVINTFVKHTPDEYKKCILWTCQNVCEALLYLLDNVLLDLELNFKEKNVGVPMGTNCAPLVADLFLFCYERDFMKSLSRENQADIIEVLLLLVLVFLSVRFSIEVISLGEERAGICASLAIVFFILHALNFDLFLFLLVSGVDCDLCLWHSLDFSINFIFNSTSRYLDDLLNINNVHFE